MMPIKKVNIKNSKINPERKMRIHFMGVAGSGTKGVYDLASKMGYFVRGCDLKNGGHDERHLKDVDLLVVSPAVLFQNINHPEYVLAKERGIAITWEDFLGNYLLKNKRIIAIAGTHGKSTTTAMSGKLLIDAGYDPTVVLGATVPEWKGNSRYGKGDYAIVEADEFNNNFLNYHPEIILINNIEFDHPDFFTDEKQVFDSFDKFVDNLTGKKILITQRDSLHKHFNLKVFGEHNQKNANMVYLLGKALGIEDKTIVKSLEEFNGIGRRMELLGTSKSGFLVYDDYAHHPTAIKTTLDGVRENFPDKKIWAVIEAHGFKRTSKLLNQYQNIFDSVDGVIIGPIFKARDKETFGMNPKKIAKTSKHKNIFTAETTKVLFRLIKNYVKKGNLVIVMGAGESDQWARQLLLI